MTPLDVADWRRRVFALYAEVRETPDAAAAHTRWRTVRDELFLHHPASALMADDRPGFTGLPVAAYDPAWRFELDLEPAEEGRFDYETGTDGLVPFERIGQVRVPEVGSLDVWRLTSYGGGIFVPVKDALKGRPGGTYGGGRYLIDTIKGADLGSDPEANTLVLDFNFAYNPSCAYDPAWACPLAPAGNTVAVEIPVGERYFGVS
ncbi:DUF1684 domain-containing protein [Lysinimonas soli]|uniref:DUF1684 domain-containing protein n=1 Tax=Lysinimonas soli TaxID=1074233 RepID=A0ABW0NT52_9MICO